MGVLLVAALILVALHGAFLVWRRGSLPGEVLFRDLVMAVVLSLAVRLGASYALELAWWKELGQLSTFWRLLELGSLPQALAGLVGAVLAAAVFRLALRRARGSSRAGGPRWLPLAGTAASAAGGLLLSMGAFDSWTAALWWGARDTGLYADPLFGRDLAFYFYRLPFYEMALGWATVLVAVCAAAAVAGLLAGSASVSFMPRPDQPLRLEPPPPAVLGAASGVVRRTLAAFLLLYAAGAVLGRYDLLYSQHRFLYGADYVDARLGVWLCWAKAALGLALALAVLSSRRRRFIVDEGLTALDAAVEAVPRSTWALLLGGVAAAFFLPPLLEGVVRSVYVQPNELTLERPYIEHHIDATLSAFNLAENAHEEPFSPKDTETLDLASEPDVAANIRLWDWKPFHDNATQRQALRPYYSFPEIDTDRYTVGGRTRQVLLAARSLETDLLPGTAQTWVNLNLQYTHGYGAVAALVNSATDEGAPEMVLKDAPPQTSLPALKITRPELYFGPGADRPVFVDSDQKEFDYPKGDDNAYTTYAGTAGIPVGSPLMRLTAAVGLGDWNVLLTRYLTKDSRLLMYRRVRERVSRLAPFLTLDPDPYLVVDDSGRLFWMLDAYTMTDRNPYSQPIDLGEDQGAVNYIRNSVKITVDAYNGTVHFYVFDEKDPLLAAYRRLLPGLFEPRSAMPADLLRHIRYPEMIFRLQAETYRTFHMRDPQVFYNKEDQWDVAKQVVSQEETRYTNPYYTMLPLPGDKQAEFALMLPFTSHNRDNLIAWIAARCDPAHYGEVVFYRLPKEQLIYGPLQVQSRVDQDRDISKDLSLWNQQGSRVLRGTTLVLPVQGTFLYVEPIYIQSTQAQMPELKKVVLAVGNRLVYADDLPEAIARLARPPAPEETAQAAASEAQPAASAPSEPTAALPRGEAALVRSLRAHMLRYRQLTASGKLSEAGRELEAVEKELSK